MFDQRSYGVDPATGQIDYAALRESAQRVQAAGDRGRLLGVPAQGELPHHARDRRRGRRHLHGRHGALRRPGRGQGLHRRLRPGPARAHRHHDHAQEPARPARRRGALPARAGRPGRPRLPDGARRPARPRDGGQGDRLRRGPPAGVRRLRPAHRRPTARRSPRACSSAACSWSAAAPTTTWC